MNKSLTRDHYYKIILETLSQNNFWDIHSFFDRKYKQHYTANSHLLEILYIDINYIMKDIIIEDAENISYEEGTFTIKKSGLNLTGNIANIHHAISRIEWDLNNMLSVYGISDPDNKLKRCRTDFSYINSTPIYKQQLDALVSLLKPVTQKIYNEKIRKKRVKVPAKLRAELQKEIHSECPFCSNGDIGHFEIHHIDNDPSNGIASNLLLLCPLCHSKITKGDITKSEVINLKTLIQTGIKRSIELASVNIDSENCSWVPDEEIENCFFDEVSSKSPFPILDFNFINHSDKTIILKKIIIKQKYLPEGLSGLPADPSMVKMLTKYQIEIKGEKTIFRINDTFQVPAKQAFRFQAELFKKHYDTKEPVSIEGRKVFYFSFEFSNNIIVNAPSIYFNSTDDSGIQLMALM